MLDSIDDLRAAARRLLAQLRWHRRPLAAALLVLAAISALLAFVDEEPTVPVLVASKDLRAGDRVDADALAVTRVPAELAPVDSSAEADALVGRTLALPVRAGEILTELRFVDRPLLDALRSPDGATLVATGVPLADPTVATLVRPGDLVDVLASGEAGTGGAVVAGVRVLVPAEPPDRPAVAGPAGRPTHVVLVVTGEQAAALARAAGTSQLSLALRGS